MKRPAWFLWIVLLAVVGYSSPALPYYLDAPHNESNGIYCATCHNSPAFKAPEPVGNIDDTRRNAVCLQCHTETPTSDFMPFKGPAKKLHASSSINSGKFGQWTTECTQCHDVHYQGQLDWADDPDIYLATGTVAADNLPYNSVTRSTTVTITTPSANPEGSGWDNTATWVAKGGRVDAAGAVDNTRGLIFVPDQDNPETYEIIAATDTSVTVKGKMTVKAGATYGVIYGQSIKSYVLPNGGSKVSDLRAVRFYRPEVVPNTFGGYVDETAGSTKPAGLCQVCHTSALMQWKKTGEAQTHHVGEICGTCHDALEGFQPAKNHNLFIVSPAVNGCSCHASKLTNPDSAHTGGCTVCHTETKPEINTNAMLTEAAGTVLANLRGTVYTGGATGSRLKDGADKGISDAGFTPISCGSCHVGKPGLVASEAHGHSHANSTFNWAGNCGDCHSGANIAADVHGNDCLLCHVTDLGGARKVGDASNGIDGHANYETAGSSCLDCHNDNTKGTIHHVSKSGYAATGDCVHCHNVSTTDGKQPGNHTGDHTNRVGGQDNCTACHAANVGSADGAPVDPDNNKIHDACTTCHENNGSLKVAYGKASAMPLGGGNCIDCHGAYFLNHSNADHTTKVAMNANCSSCHEGTQGTATGVPVDNLNNLRHDDCTTCHDGGNGTLVGLAAGHPGGGDCLSCHAGHDTEQVHNHRVTSGLATDCTGCHAVGDAAAIDTLHTGCQTCHGYTGNRLSPTTVAAVIADGRGNGGSDQNCEACHTVNIHHTSREAVNNNCANTCHPWVDHGGRVAGNAACNSCHTGTAGSVAGISVSLTDATIHDSCRTCHTFDGQGNGILVNFTNQNGVNGTGPLPAGGGNCTVCHTVATATPTSAIMASFHHTSPRTAVGQCETCHPDPRSSWQPVEPGDNGSASGLPRPTQMACLKCHVTFSGTSMTVTKFSRSDYASYRYDWTRTTAHTIPVTAGRINNYGICLNCHYQGSSKVLASAQMSVWHAHPSRFGGEAWTFYDQGWGDTAGKTWERGSSSSWATPPGGYANYAPGRSRTLATQSGMKSGIGGFNIFAPNYGANGRLNNWNTNWPSDTSDKDSFTGPAYDTPSFTRIALPAMVAQIGDPTSATLNATTRSVPVFASLAPLNAASPATDNVKVKSATYSGGAVTVRASTSNSGGCSTLTANYGDTPVMMSGAPSNCTATISSPAYPDGGSTVDVTTINSLGLNVLDYPIKSSNAGVIAFSASTYSVAENGGSVTITASRLVGSSGVVGVSYATSNGTAVAGTDYTASSGTLSWADGDTADQTFTVAVTNNAAVGGNRTVNLMLSDATGGATLVNPNIAVLTIVDDEILAGTIAFSASAYSVAENGGTVTISATRTGSSTGAVSVDYGTYSANPESAGVVGTDYPATSGTLSWASGDMAAKNFTITTINHGQIKGNRTVDLYLSNVKGGAVVGAQNTAVLTIVSPAVQVLDAWPSTPQFTGTSGNLSGTFSIGSGSNRLLLVAVSCLYSNGQSGQTFVVKYGDQTLTQIALLNNRVRQSSWLGYLKESDIAAKTGNTLTVTVTGTHSSVAAFAASYFNVNQTSPFGATGSNDWILANSQYNGTITSKIFASALGVGAGGYGIYHWTCGVNTGLSRTSDDESYTEHAELALGSGRIGVASRAFETAASTDPTVTWQQYSRPEASGAIQAITLNPADGPVSLAFATPTVSVNENDGTADISVIRLGKATGAVSVAYATSDGTAVTGTDYTTTSGTISWDDGDMSAKTFPITIFDNPDLGADKTVNLALFTPDGGAALGVPSTAVLTVVSEDSGIAFSAATNSAAENGGLATITVTRTGGFSGVAGVSYATVAGGSAVDGLDFTGVSGTLSWAAGDLSAKTFTVPILDNSAYGVDKTINLLLYEPTGTAVLVSPTAAVLTIVDDESSLYFAAPNYSVKEDTASVTVTVNRKGNSTGAVSVDYATSNGNATAGSDYTITSGTLSWGAGDLGAKTFVIPITNDTTPEENETVDISLANPTGGSFVATPSTAMLTIVDNDHHGALAFSAAAYSVDENDSTRKVVVTVTRTGGADGAVGVNYNYNATGGTATYGYGTNGDYYFYPSPGSLAWADGDTAAKTFEITINPDSVWEGDEMANLVLSTPTGGASLGGQSTAVLTIVDNEDRPGTIALSSATYSVDEDGGLATISATRSNGYNQAVSINYATANGTGVAGSDYSATSGTLSWANHETGSKSFVVPVTNNAVSAANKTVNLTIGSPGGGASLGSPNVAVLNIVDDEGHSGSISLSSSAYSVAESGGTVTITASRSGGSVGAVSVSYATASGGTATAGADYTGVSGTLTWATGVSGSKSFTVPILPDAVVEGDETFNVNLTNPIGGATLGTASAVVTIEAPGVTVLDPWPAIPQFTAYQASPATQTFAIGNGSNRLLVVAISCSSATQIGQPFSVTYGGMPLTQAAIQNINSKQTWLGYLREDELVNRSGNTLSITASGTFAYFGASIASYSNVNQASPVSASGGVSIMDLLINGWSSPSPILISPSPLLVGAGGYGIYNWSNYYSQNRISDDEGYTENFEKYLTNGTIGVATKPFTSGAITQPKVAWDSSISGANAGTAVSFITLNKFGAACVGGACQPPILTTPTASSITSTTAILGANVTADGGAAVTSRGTVLGTSAHPTANAATEGAFTTGSFSQSRSGLTAGTKYYYRGYAINTAGTGYSSDGSFYTEPSTQASGLSFSAIDLTSMKLSWTRGSGDGVIVLMKQGAAVDSDPLDGTYAGYVANSIFGGFAPIGTGNYVVYKGTGTSVTVSGLTQGTIYYVAVYEYQGSGDTLGADQGTNYRSFPVTGNQTTSNLAISPANPPILAFPTATTIGSSTATLGANITSEGDAAIVSRGTVWGTSPQPTGNFLAEGGTSTGTFSHLRIELPAATKIYYRGYATNSATGYSLDGSFYTEPGVPATMQAFTAVSYTWLTANWTRGDGDGVIVLMRQGSPVDATPADGSYTGYTSNSAFGSGSQIGSGNYVVYKGSGSSVSVTGLTSGIKYYLAVFEYKGSVDTLGVDLGTNYTTAGSSSCTTYCTAPTLAGPQAYSIGSTTATLGVEVTSTGTAFWERGTVWDVTPNPVNNYLVDAVTPLGYDGQNRTGLPAATKIYYRGCATYANGTVYSSTASFYTEPASGASPDFTEVSANSMTVSWMPGDGDGVLVLMRDGAAVDAAPVDGTYTAYTANPAFGGGSKIGSNNYVIYKGSGTSVTVTGLTSGHTYYAAIYRYAGIVDTFDVDQGTNYNPLANSYGCTAQDPPPPVVPARTIEAGNPFQTMLGMPGGTFPPVVTLSKASYSVPPGIDRLLLVVLHYEALDPFASIPIYADYGMEHLIEVQRIDSGYERVWVGYLPESGIAVSDNQPLQVWIEGSVGTAVFTAGTFTNVNQGAPIYSSQKSYSESAQQFFDFAGSPFQEPPQSPLPVVNGGLAIYFGTYDDATTTQVPPPDFTEVYNRHTGGGTMFTYSSADKMITADGISIGTIMLSQPEPFGVVAISLQP